MPRNGSGSYSLPEAAFVPNTAISSSAVNSDFSDIASALTGSLARDGQGGMTAVLPLANLGFTYLNDPNTGMRRTAADTQAITCGNIDIIGITTTDVSITGNLAVSGVFTVGGAPLLPIGLGPLPWSGLTAPTKWLLCYGQSLLRASYPDLWTFAQAEIAAGNVLFTNGNGTTTFTIMDMRGRLPAGKDNMGGVAANRLTPTYFIGDSTTLGVAGGFESNTLTTPQIPSHTHVNTLTDPGHTHSYNAPLSFGNSGAGAGILGSQQTSTTGSNTTGISINNVAAGGGNPHPNVQPTIITNYIIYAGV